MRTISRRTFVATAAAVGAGAILRAPALALDNQSPVASSTAGLKSAGRDAVAPQAVPFPAKDVRLQPGAFSAAAEANRKYLKTLPPDRLLHTFRREAGLASSAEPLGDWEKTDCELRGHFAGGHYLSACALAFASSGDEELKRNGDLMVAELAKCQAQRKNGYLSAFPQGREPGGTRGYDHAECLGRKAADAQNQKRNPARLLSASGWQSSCGATSEAGQQTRGACCSQLVTEPLGMPTWW